MELQPESRKFYKWKVSKAFSGKSLLFFLEQQLPSIPSKRALKKAIEKNLCFVNAKREHFASKKVLFQDEVKLDTKWQEHLSEKSEKITVIFEDESLSVIVKPSNIICDNEYFQKKGLFLCHRLDKETTGLLLLAKNKSVRENLFKQFEERNIHKEYLAIVDKAVKNTKGKIENTLIKKSSYQGQTIYGSGVFGSGERGKTAITHWTCLSKSSDSSFLLLKPETGRTHQLRVHLSEMGHPILGDFQYCRSFSNRHFVPRILLHSYKLSFTHPIHGKPISIVSEIPKDFLDCAKKFDLCLNIS